jgi:hypothetical protein
LENFVYIDFDYLLLIIANTVMSEQPESKEERTENWHNQGVSLELVECKHAGCNELFHPKNMFHPKKKKREHCSIHRQEYWDATLHVRIARQNDKCSERKCTFKCQNCDRCSCTHGVETTFWQFDKCRDCEQKHTEFLEK